MARGWGGRESAQAVGRLWLLWLCPRAGGLAQQFAHIREEGEDLQVGGLEKVAEGIF